MKIELALLVEIGCQNEEDKRIFFNALTNPPSPNDRLKQTRLTYLKIKSEMENEALQIEENSQEE